MFFHSGDPDSGDGWTIAADGSRCWGRFGAAGLLAHDPDRGVLLQHRAAWSHSGNTWGVPGGALHRTEHVVAGALREAAEEAAVPAGAVTPLALDVFDRGGWAYTTVIASVVTPFEPRALDGESHDLVWVPIDEVNDLPLHPAFAASWPRLRSALERPPVLVVDAANVVGSRPNGWWKDRPGAATALLDNLERLAFRGVDGSLLDLPEAWVWPRTVVVLEGQAKTAAATWTPQARNGLTGTAPRPPQVVAAPGEGDDAIAAVAGRLGEQGAAVSVVTADRALRDRVASSGAHLVGPGALLDLLDRCS